MKTILIFTLVGALLGIAGASVVVPRTLAWYNEAGYLSQPQGGQPQALVNLPQVIRYTTDRLIKGQLIGGIAGAAVFLFFGILAARSGSRRRREASVPRAPVAPGPGVPQP
ncbi:MAG: hypothetical protein M3167_18900 [Acidobacteriota bacterium]|nr:hypothetical protein [Acidobacteriota bacterium]